MPHLPQIYLVASSVPKQNIYIHPPPVLLGYPLPLYFLQYNRPPPQPASDTSAILPGPEQENIKNIRNVHQVKYKLIPCRDVNIL